MAPTLESADLVAPPDIQQTRIVFTATMAVVVAVAATVAAEVLVALIALITNLAFYQRVSFENLQPAGHGLGPLVIVIPVIGGVIVGLMARFGTSAIRGHGIPEAMERVLHAESRISPKVTFFKPVSSAVAIGTGGPFGAEGPIIATGGALGSFVGQVLKTTADERKVLLAAGAAAGTAAIFGSPVAAVLLSVELLLFEYRSRSLVPIALASAVATAIRMALHGSAPIFPMPLIPQPGGAALATYVVIGALIGVVAVYVTRLLYHVEDLFEKLPVHWMWWPAIGGLAVGIIGFVSPRTMGVGYINIEQIVSGELVGTALAALVVFKLISWVIALGSGTSGGTLAPLFTIGGGIGALIGRGLAVAVPALGVDARVAGLVGMAAIFAGASRALLTSVIFAFEVTRQPMGLLPLLGGCSAAYLISMLMMRNTIMTERLARRGAPVRTEYSVDYLDQVLVRDYAAHPVVTLAADDLLGEVRAWLAGGRGETRGANHQGFPVLDAKGRLVGVVTRRNLTDAAATDEMRIRDIITRLPTVIYDDNTMREAADHMVRKGVGRLPVISHDGQRRLVGIITRSDLLEAHQRRLDASGRAVRSIRFGRRPAAKAPRHQNP